MKQFSNDGLTFDVRDSADLQHTVAGGPVTSGDGGAPDVVVAETVVLLHGFPQDGSAWDDVTPRLVEAGRRTLAPDLRGYSAGARPTKRAAYTMPRLVGDVMALLDDAGVERAHVVGHDWGGALAWAVAMSRPERVERLTVLSTPHPAAMQWAARHSTQALKSWYMLAFQLPILPELLLGQTLKRVGMAGLGVRPEHERQYVETLTEPGGLTGALNWYRALALGLVGGAGAPTRPVTCPTTYLWGNRDAYLGRAAAEATEEHVEGPYRFIELDADHWLPEKRPDDVANAILEPVGLE